MIEHYVQQLQSRDSVERRAAISALANLRDPAALPALATVYRTDPDPALRELALQAGRYIRQHGTAGAGPGQASPPPGTDAPPYEKTARPEREITERDRELAKGFLNAATTFHLNGDKARAIDNLGKALSMNPDLRKDSFATNLIMTLTDKSIDEGFALLTHPDRRAALVAAAGGKKKLKAELDRPGIEKATWDNVAMDFGVYWLVATLSIIAIFVLGMSMLRDLIDTMPASATATSTDLDALYNASVIALVLIGVFYGFSTTISLLIQGGAIHVAATYVLGGDGTLAYLYRRLVPFQTVILLITAGLFVVLALAGSIVSLMFVIGLGSAFGSIAILYWLSKLVGEVYGFGAGSGCGAIVIGSILIAIVSACGNYVILSIVGALLGSAT